VTRSLPSAINPTNLVTATKADFCAAGATDATNIVAAKAIA
jgi:hypothetical protein